ncbi:MAG: nitrate reductase [Calditrichaeota bacterium]|nr:MAG: nitrate reductase [Calditrichota bacterium]
MEFISRRKFLKIGGASLAATTAIGNAKLFDSKRATELRQVPTFCDICFWKCGAIATIQDGKLWKVEGNPKDPLSRGRLCPRGSGGIGAHYDPDRLKTPLMRKSVRGEEEWVAVSWDEALGFIADKMKKIKADYGPEAMALFSHGIGGNFLKHMLKAYGSANIAAPSFAQCRGPRDVGFKLTFGEDVSSPERTDIRNAECLVLIGSHLGENMHNTQVQEFGDAIAQDAEIIVVDPRFSVAASKAKYYLPIKPGADLALLLAWMNVLVTENLYNQDYVTKYGFGFDHFVNEILPFTPEWAYPETGIEPDLIRQTARVMARHKPATLIHPGRHVTWYGDDAQRSRAIALLNALMGNWGVKGGFYYPVSMDIPGYPYPEYPHSERPKVDNPDNKYPFAHETITNGIREATLTGNPYPIKGWLVYATNLMHALPNEKETIQAIQNLDLMVVIDVIPAEIAGWADVVLPESVYLERYDDLNVEWFREPFTALRQPVIDPPHDQKPNWWIAKTLAEKLDLGHYFPWKDIEEYLSYRINQAGLSYEQLKSEGILLGEKQPIYFSEGVPDVFPTPSGKIEFYSLQLAQAGFDAVPKYTKPPQPPPGYFRLLYGRSPVHSFSRTQSNRILMDMMDENEVWINQDVAGRYGLKSGDYIRLKNQDGVVSNRIKVKATERIRTDCVYMIHGFGHNSRMLKFAYEKGVSDAQLITQYTVDPLMGGTAMNVNFVTLELEA